MADGSSPTPSTPRTPLTNVPLFERFASCDRLMDDPSLLWPEEPPAEPALTPEMMRRLSERGKRLLEPDDDDDDDEVGEEDGGRLSTCSSKRSVRDEERRAALESEFSTANSGDTHPDDEEKCCPWVVGSSSSSSSSTYSPNTWVGLHEEILDYVNYIQPSEAELTQRNRVVQEVHMICKHLWPHCNPRCFGSMATRLLLPTSDIDICVSDVDDDIQSALTQIANSIAHQKLCASVHPRLIRNTRVPLVKFVHAETGYNVDISINAEEGVANTEIIRDVLGLYPAAYPLILVIKMFLQRRRLHETYYGGLGSYGTTLLVISFLQHHPSNQLSANFRERVTLGMLLVDFFRYYGQACNWPQVGISVQNGGYFYKKRGDDARGLVLEDPCNPSNNVAAATRHFGGICRTFNHAHTILVSDAPCAQRLTGVTVDGRSPAEYTRLSRVLWMTRGEVRRRKMVEAKDSAWQQQAQEVKRRVVGGGGGSAAEVIPTGDDDAEIANTRRTTSPPKKRSTQKQGEQQQQRGSSRSPRLSAQRTSPPRKARRQNH
eukprot:PhM_4_TR6319/c0_g1_i1/m.31593/K03514/PAPD5_7, TRF4; non-canonical poly(A) RNA polymerase PAPD5/7